MLVQHGWPPDALDDAPTCKKCGDTGWVQGQMCSCLKALCAQEQVKELSKLLDLGEQSFDSFSLDWYSPLPWPGESASPRDNMELIYDVCINYAQKFGRFYFKNLFLTGDPGLGKTFLSACIAKVVSENGWSVAYDSASACLGAFEKERFSRDGDEKAAAGATVRQYLSCDLMILDDLGTEMNTSAAQSALYTLINHRLTAGKQTIISTNLSEPELEQQYSPQIASRLLGEYQWLHFLGTDIRRR